MKLWILILFWFLPEGIMAFSIDTMSVYSPCMQKKSEVIVIVPDTLLDTQDKFPVLYLLHGYGGDYASWLKLAPDLGRIADENRMMLVCPDGGVRSWYINSPIDSTFRYETHFIEELIPWVDDHYRTLRDRKFRAITGLSMGGHGAFYLAFRHPDVFGAAGSMSGGLDLRQFTASWNLKEKILGDTICCKENWEACTVINVANSLVDGQLQIVFDCGLDDFFLEVNRAFHQKLITKHIAHDYTERPGEHNSKYWRNSLDYHILYFRKFFESSTP